MNVGRFLMARARNHQNGRLEEAMATLLQNQALFVAQMAETNRRMDERFARMDERFVRMDERFARMEAILVQHSQILNEHTRILQTLPEAVREKIGFKPAEPP
jgi:hypothetical protein